MTAERSSEDNDGHQVRATIGLAGGCALQRRCPYRPQPPRLQEGQLAVCEVAVVPLNPSSGTWRNPLRGE